MLRESKSVVGSIERMLPSSTANQGMLHFLRVFGLPQSKRIVQSFLETKSGPNCPELELKVNEKPALMIQWRGPLFETGNHSQPSGGWPPNRIYPPVVRSRLRQKW